MRSMKILLIFSVLAGMAIGQTSTVRDRSDDMWLKYDSGPGIYASRPTRPLCTVPASKSPNVRGKWRLGMAEPDRPAIVLVDGASLKDVDRTISTSETYFERKLIRLRAVYRNEITWDSAAEFAFVIAKEFDLPAAAWRENSPSSLVMFCDGWMILVEPNRIDIRDEAAIDRKAKIEAAAKSAAAEEKKKTFKP